MMHRSCHCWIGISEEVGACWFCGPNIHGPEMKGTPDGFLSSDLPCRQKADKLFFDNLKGSSGEAPLSLPKESFQQAEQVFKILQKVLKIYRLKAKGTPDGFLSGYLPFRRKVDIVDAVENRETVFKAGKVRRRMKCPGVSCKVPRLAVLRPRCGAERRTG